MISVAHEQIHVAADTGKRLEAPQKAVQAVMA
jgi:hypothetical protein